MKMFQIPSPFPLELSKEERLKAIRAAGEQAREEFGPKYAEIAKWFDEYDSLYILSYVAFYFLSHVEGTDPEATGSLEFLAHYLEIMQAFALMQPRTISARPLVGEGARLKKEIREVGTLMQRRLLAIPEGVSTDEAIHQYRLRTEMMSHTTAVRNWAYNHQMRRITTDLMGLVATEFEAIHGVDPSAVVHMLHRLGEVVTDRLNAHIDKIRMWGRKRNHREMVAAYAKAYPEKVPMTPEEADMLWERAGRDVSQVAGMLFAHSDLGLHEIYSFMVDEAAAHYGDVSKRDAIGRLLSRLSYGFEDLRDHPKEYLILDNPVHRKPFIKLPEDAFFSAIHGVIPHFALLMMETLIADEEQLRILYATRKAKYLEHSMEQLFRAHFPNASLLAGGEWVDPHTGVIYENDLLVVIDRFAIIVEGKSGTVTPPARRGAPDRLFETLRALIEEPSAQAHRLLTHLKAATAPVTLTNEAGATITVDPAVVKYHIPLAVTLEQLGTISSNLKALREAAVITKPMEELALCLNLSDLEIVLELLDSEAERIHYFARRREFERHVDYLGDELDLLGFYLDTGFNIGQDEYAGEIGLMLLLKSKELDPYVVGHSEGRDIEKPTLAMTRWWRDLLSVLGVKRFRGWLEASYVLLNMAKVDQEKLENGFRELVDTIRDGKVDQPHNWVTCVTGPTERRFMVAVYPYTTDEKELRNNIMNQIINDKEAGTLRGAVVIGVNLKRMDYPYSVFGSRLETDLFG
jgi:hypothetical protein